MNLDPPCSRTSKVLANCNCFSSHRSCLAASCRWFLISHKYVPPVSTYQFKLSMKVSLLSNLWFFCTPLFLNEIAQSETVSIFCLSPPVPGLPTAAWWSCLGVWSKTKEPHRLIPLWIRDDSSTIKLWFHAVAKFGSSLGCFSLNHGSRTQRWEWPAQVPKQTRKIHADESHFWLDIQ